MIAQPAREHSIVALAIIALVLFSACSSSPVTTGARDDGHENRPSQPSAGHRAAAIAMQQVGVPYRYGGSNPKGFDCSGLVQYSYARAGLRVPRTTGELWTAMRPVGRHELETGDLLFFRVDGKMSHVGLYLGQQRFVHAPSSGRAVSVATLESPYYDKTFVRAGRPE